MIPAIIVARGGSKRLPRKNVLPICGHPLIAWTIIQARYCKYITETWLSTDDDEIADIARGYGARIIRRPNWENPDELSAGKPLEHAVCQIRKQYFFDIHLVCLPTSVCIHPWDLDKLFEAYFKIKDDFPTMSQFTPLAKTREIYVHKKLQYGLANPVLGSKKFDYLTGGFARIITKTDIWLKQQSQIKTHNIQGIEKPLSDPSFYKPVYPYHECEWYQGIDIDDRETFELNQILMEKYILKGQGIEIYRKYAEQRDKTKMEVRNE